MTLNSFLTLQFRYMLKATYVICFVYLNSTYISALGNLMR